MGLKPVKNNYCSHDLFPFQCFLLYVLLSSNVFHVNGSFQCQGRVTIFSFQCVNNIVPYVCLCLIRFQQHNSRFLGSIHGKGSTVHHQSSDIAPQTWNETKLTA